MISLSDGQAVVEIEPERGGLVTRFDVGARRVLFMDEATLRDPTKNVRGGIPVLFPTPGKLADDKWAYAGHTGALKQHGFARNLPWRVVDAGRTTATIALAADDATRAAFPWDFTVEMTFLLRGSALRLDHRVTNTGAAAMPFGFGFHPYFFVADADKPRVRIATAATRAFDNATKQTVAVTQPIDLTRDEVDLHLLDHGASESTLATPAGDVRLRGSIDYTHWVVWTLAGRDFVCLEPWTCPGNALNTGERLLVLAPAESRALSLEISV
jgi:galactose mutarotase-like enzyme